jgi:hypothetical protein
VQDGRPQDIQEQDGQVQGGYEQGCQVQDGQLQVVMSRTVRRKGQVQDGQEQNCQKAGSGVRWSWAELSEGRVRCRMVCCRIVRS